MTNPEETKKFEQIENDHKNKLLNKICGFQVKNQTNNNNICIMTKFWVVKKSEK